MSVKANGWQRLLSQDGIAPLISGQFHVNSQGSSQARSITKSASEYGAHSDCWSPFRAFLDKSHRISCGTQTNQSGKFILASVRVLKVREVLNKRSRNSILLAGGNMICKPSAYEVTNLAYVTRR